MGRKSKPWAGITTWKTEQGFSTTLLDLDKSTTADIPIGDSDARGHSFILLRFPFEARYIASKVVSPLRKRETVEVRSMAPEDACQSDMLVLIRWQGHSMAVPLSQLANIDGDTSTAETIADWH